MKRVLLAIVLAGLTLIALAAPAAESGLPEGPGTPALVSKHFPDRLHEFVWRNWGIVDAGKLAAVTGALPEDITAIAESMGLPPDMPVEPQMRERGYVTLIRRNWHLLPYEQLLTLLDMTPERLGVMLREEDFLWIKLGQVKPKCEPLRYQPPDDAARRRAAEIRQVVEQEFGAGIQRGGEGRFDFVRRLAEPLAETPAPRDEPDQVLRIVYSYVAVYGDPLMNPALNPYPDGLLARLAAAGINGVWLQGLLRDLAPGGDAFPEFGAGHEARLANLRALVERAARHGIRVYLYINEPRAMPAAFFESHPDMAGVHEGALTTLCTSQPAVRQWMADALAHIFREVPGLGGIYTITASENLTNCASHGAWQNCPRCKERTDADILAEVAATLEEGVHRGNPDAKVLVSDWGWRGHGDARDIIPRLPKSVYLMSVSEWSLPIERGGIQSVVGEYAISAVGPGPRAQAHWKTAAEAHLKMGTEIQFNNTCEIASIPYLPVLDLVAEHCANLKAATNLDAMFIGWTMGGHPSPNFRLAQLMRSLDAESALDTLARERFGETGAPHARKAWTQMSAAFREYPYHISVLYTSPVQWGPANPLYMEKTGYSATMWGIPYDDLAGWRGPYPPEVFAAQFEKVAAGWNAAMPELEAAVDCAPPERRGDVRADLLFAQAAAMHFQAVANQARFVAARDALAEPGLAPEQRRPHEDALRQAVESEMALAKQLYLLTKQDSRIGFEPSCQYFYLPLDLVEKVVNCRWILAR